MTLFEGLRRVYGRYEVPRDAVPDAEGKLLGVRSTRHGEVTLSLYERHLAGEIGFGAVPINDDSMARFGAIDCDVYPLDLKALNRRCAELGLPVVLCRTKSGGAHLYLFTKSFVPAELIRSKLMDWAVALGPPFYYAEIEVFPKQTKLASDRDEGNWINLPYQEAAKTTRYALDPDSKRLTLEGFLAYAEEMALSEDELTAFEPRKDPSSDAFEGAPPCLQTLSARGFGDWQNNGLFNVGVYLRKRYAEGWEKKLQEYNLRLMVPPVEAKDVAATIKSLNKKKYSFMCKQAPINAVCNKQVCLTRQFGIGGAVGDAGVVFGELVVLETDPPTWIWDVDGARLELTTQELMDQRRFHGLAMERLRKWPNFIQDEEWRKMVRDRLLKATTVSVPEDATKEGQLWVHLSRFCTSRVVGRSMDELLMGKPYTDEGARRTYFCSSDFLAYLQQHRMTGISEKELFRFLRRRGVEHHFAVIKGKGLNHWSVPAFDRQTEEHSVPRKPPQEAM